MRNVLTHVGIRTSVQAFKFKCCVPGQRWTLIEMNKNTADVLLLKFWIVAVLGMDPVLSSEKDLANKLEATQDTQGFIWCVRKLFMQLSGKKKISKKSWICISDFMSCRCMCVWVCVWERGGGENLSGKFYETKKSESKKFVFLFPELWNTSRCEQSVSVMLLYAVKSHIFNFGYFEISELKQNCFHEFHLLYIL